MKNRFNNFVEVERMLQFLDIKEVTTKRQKKNGTREFELPIKSEYNGNKLRVASFASGYVRRQNGCYTPYQLNKRCEGEPEYYKDYKYVDNKQVFTGKYRMFTTRGCILIPDEQDRLAYLISYCLKNYYIKHANFVADGEYIPKWEHESELAQLQDRYDRLADAARLDYDCGHYDRIRDLENKLDTIKRISEY